MSSDPDTTRVVRSWMDEGVTQLPDRVLDAVLDQLPATPQRRAGWLAWRSPFMNKIAGFGLAAAALVAVVLIGSQLLGSPSGDIGGPGGEPTPPTSSDSPPKASVSPSAENPERSVVVTKSDAPVQTTVEITSSGWVPLPGLDGLTKRDDGLDPPESVGVALLAWAWPAETQFNVYGDPCRWSSTIPETPATTADEIAAALAAQASTDATAPVDVTVGGYPGKAVTLHVPMTFDLPNATREERFAACDGAVFGFYGIQGESDPSRNAQGAGQVDELWILDVDGSIVILDAAYSPATPDSLVEELRAVAKSATFQAP